MNKNPQSSSQPLIISSSETDNNSSVDESATSAKMSANHIPNESLSSSKVTNGQVVNDSSVSSQMIHNQSPHNSPGSSKMSSSQSQDNSSGSSKMSSKQSPHDSPGSSKMSSNQSLDNSSKISRNQSQDNSPGSSKMSSNQSPHDSPGSPKINVMQSPHDTPGSSKINHKHSSNDSPTSPEMGSDEDDDFDPFPEMCFKQAHNESHDSLNTKESPSTESYSTVKLNLPLAGYSNPPKSCDNYSHSDLSIIYVTENIPGPVEDTLEYVVLQEDYNSIMHESCKCKNQCTEPCLCLSLSGGVSYDTISVNGKIRHLLHQNPNSDYEYPILECNSNCSCPPTCGNRVVQKGPIDGLVVKECADIEKGKGLFTTQMIDKGTFICEYAGELLTKKEAVLRTHVNLVQGKMNYIFCLNEHYGRNLIQTFVDPSKFGNIGRYVNHSCSANSSVMPVRSELVIPHLAIFANFDIHPGQEITINYGANRLAGPDLFPYTEKKECFCYSLDCQKIMPYENF